MPATVWDLPELLLSVAEHSDLPTISTLMRTNRNLYATIRLYERSICRKLLDKLELFPVAGKLLTPKDQSDQSDQSDEVLQICSFVSVTELQCRHRRILDVVDGQFLAAAELIPPQGRAQYLLGLRRALHICDAIGDVEVDVADPDQNAPQTLFNTNDAQIKHIKDLPLIDLAFLAELAWLGSRGWVRSKGVEADGGGDAFPYQAYSFEELVLSRGSRFLWAYGMGSAQKKAYTQRLIVRGASDILVWESTEGPQQPSLRQIVLHTIMERSKCRFQDTFKHIHHLTHPEAKKSTTASEP